MPPIGPDDAALHPGQVGHASPSLFTGTGRRRGDVPARQRLARTGSRRARAPPRRAGTPTLVGPLLVPAGRVPELTELVAGQSLPGPLAIGVIAPDGVDAAAEAVVMAASSAAGSRSLDWSCRSTEPRRADRLGPARWRHPAPSGGRSTATVTCERSSTRWPAPGATSAAPSSAPAGLRPRRFPSEPEVAAFLRHAIDVDLAFKLTAGLHHAVRGTDPATGFEHTAS